MKWFDNIRLSETRFWRVFRIGITVIFMGAFGYLWWLLVRNPSLAILLWWALPALLAPPITELIDRLRHPLLGTIDGGFWLAIRDIDLWIIASLWPWLVLRMAWEGWK